MTRAEDVDEKRASHAARAKRRVLVVDDNVDAAEMLAALLELGGYEARTVAGGAEALASAKESAPDFVFLDIGLPDMDGREVARRFRSDPALSEVRLVALTGWGGAEEMRRSQEAGFDEHLTKPVEPAAIEAVLERLSASPLLGADEPSPFRVQEGDPLSPFVFTCDHAGRLLPKALGDLGLTAAEREQHIAWDIGAAGVAEELGRKLRAFVIQQTYSRLAIDCNRPLHAKSSIATQSEATVIPGNRELSTAERARRAEAIFVPYHRRLDQELERRRLAGVPTVYVAIHSFTPTYLGVGRPWHVGVLSHKDRRFADVLLELLRGEPDWVVGDNEPYSVHEESDYGIVEHAERRGLLHVELEIRQDLIAEPSGQHAMAERFARLLRAALERTGSG